MHNDQNTDLAKVESSRDNRRCDHDEHQHHALVIVTVDNKHKKVRSGDYLVSQFKELIGVAAGRALDEVVEGEFKALNDSTTIEIEGGEIFVSHVRTGSSS